MFKEEDIASGAAERFMYDTVMDLGSNFGIPVTDHNPEIDHRYTYIGERNNGITESTQEESVAKQIQGSGMQIPGFRRDPRIVEKVLERYIPTVTVFSGAVVGFLAAGADMIGTVGQSSGTGVLLTVGIMIRMYEQIGKEQMMEMHPVLRSFFGED